MKIGRDGSSIAMPMLAKVIAPQIFIEKKITKLLIMGPGKSMYALPVTFRFPLCYVHMLTAGKGGGGRGGGKR
jgi:hypothetical protein